MYLGDLAALNMSLRSRYKDWPSCHASNVTRRSLLPGFVMSSDSDAYAAEVIDLFESLYVMFNC